MSPQVFAKDDRPHRWVIFSQAPNGALTRLYSVNRCPTGMRRIPFPASYTGNGSLTDAIRISQGTETR